MSIWIPRSTSGFSSTDGSIKIDGVCYRATQKNITKAQAPAAATYDATAHGPLGSNYSDCSTCNIDVVGESSWGACFWFNQHCGGGSYGIPGFGTEFYEMTGDGNYEYSNSSDPFYYSPDVPNFLDELVSRKTSLQKIVENPTVSSFSSLFSMPPPNDTSSNYFDWMTNATCTSSQGALTSATWSLYFLYPSALALDSFQQSGGNISIPSQNKETFSYKGSDHTLIKLLPSQSASAQVQNLSFSKT